MSTASLELLKGSKAKEVAAAPGPDQHAGATVSAPETESDSGDEQNVVDIDKLTGKELDALVEEHEIELPEGWAKLTVAAKKAWLNETFDNVDEEADDGAGKQAAAPASGKAGKAKEPKKAGTAVSTEVLETFEPTDMVGGSDLFIEIVHTVENLKEKEARELVVSLCEGAEFTYFKLGGVLSVIQANKWYAPYASFKDYVESERGLNYRTARYWIAIYNGIVESGVPWAKVKHLGWTKLKEIVQVLTVDNVDQWVALAEKQTTLQLIETVKKAQNPDDDEGGEAKTVTTKTFKLHDDQRETIEAALAKCRKVANTDVDTVALEYICLDYLAGPGAKGGGTASVPTLQQQFEAIVAANDGLLEASLTEIFAAFEKVFPTINLTVGIEDEEGS